MKNKITKNMTFADLLECSPKAAEKLADKGMLCCGCPMAIQETIEQGCLAHGEDPDKIVEELNKEEK